MRLTNSARTFGAVAATLHWLIALAIIAMIGMGYYMVRAEDYDLYQTHKSLGLTILGLSLLRLVWRFIDPPPPLPATMPGWEKAAAHISHWAFDALMIGIPLSGWAYISASPASDFIDTKFWGGWKVPLWEVLSQHEERDDIAERLEDVHKYLAYGTLALLALHIGAALKHHFWDRDRVLHAMLPVVPDPERKL